MEPQGESEHPLTLWRLQVAANVAERKQRGELLLRAL
jgi:hypothetical protein